MREIERIILLKVIDRKWTDHIDDMEQLKQGIGLQSLGQRDPVVEYKFAGYDMFNEMTRAIQEDTVKLLLRVKVEQKVEREEVNKVTGTNKDDTVSRGPVKKAKKSEEMICAHVAAVRNIRTAADGTNRNNVLRMQPIK